MRYIKFLLFFIVILINSCSTSFESISRSIILSTVYDSLKIENRTSKKIYYFAVESNFAAALNWGPSKTGPYIKSDKSVKISFNKISNGKSEPVETGDRIIVYWWTDALQNSDDIRSEVITL